MKNLLQKWEEMHFQQIKIELNQREIEITPENISKIVKATSFEQRSKRNPEQCPYYQPPLSKPCHPIKDLNCLLCACPNYESNKLEGGCKINSKKGKFTHHPNLPKEKVWDCSDCQLNHRPEEIRKYLEQNLDRLQ